MTIFRQKQIRWNIAQVLENCEPMLVPEARLRDEVNLQLQPPTTLAEFERVIATMEIHRQILRHRTEDEGIKTKLTDEGRAELRQ